MMKLNKLLISTLFIATLIFSTHTPCTYGSDQNTKKKTIYIHIGFPKTGSTSIHKFFEKNYTALLEEGIFYKAGRCGKSFLKNKHLLENALKEFDESKKTKMLILNECLLLASRNSGFFDKKEIWDLLSTYEIKIILYYRRSVDFLCSYWQNGVGNNNYDKSLSTFLENESDNRLKETIGNFYALSKKVEKRNIIVKTFEKEAWKDNNLIKDFLSIFDIEKFGKYQEVEIIKNRSPSRYKSDVRAHTNKISKTLGIPPKTFFSYYHKHIGNLAFSFTGKKIKAIDSLPDETIKEVVDKYYSEECEIAKAFLNREELFLSKYPKIYKTKRPEYKKQLSEEDKENIRSIAELFLQEQMAKNQFEELDEL